jgi:hypothetical protein
VVWFKVDDGFYTSRKVLSIPRTQRLAAVGLWTMAGNWSARELTDGKVPEYVLAEIGATSKLRQALTEARLWLDRGSAGIEFHSWADYQPTREEVEAERAKAAERQRKWRERKRDAMGDEHVSHGVTDPVTNGVSNGAPTRPDPTRPDQIEEEASLLLGEARLKEHRLPKDWTPTKAHFDLAKERGVDLATEVESFRLHAETHDRHAARWNGAFTTWLKKARPVGAKPTRRVPANDEWMYR